MKRLLGVLLLLLLGGALAYQAYPWYQLRAGRTSLERYKTAEARGHLDACLRFWPGNESAHLHSARATPSRPSPPTAASSSCTPTTTRPAGGWPSRCKRPASSTRRCATWNACATAAGPTTTCGRGWPARSNASGGETRRVPCSTP